MSKINEKIGNAVIHAFRCMKKKKPFTARGKSVNAVVCEAPAWIILENIFIPYDKPGIPNGYQRPESKSRVKKLGTTLMRKDVNFPTSILVNIRNEDAINYVQDGKFNYHPELHEDMIIMDGQHRLLSMQYAIDNLDDEDRINYLKSVEFTVLITFTEDILFEMQMFQDVNDNAKSIPANTRMSLILKRIGLADRDLAAAMEAVDENWKVVSGRIAEDLANDTDSVWYQRIKSPNSKVLSPNVGLAAITKYFGEVVKSPKVSKKGAKKQKYSRDIINAYWNGFRLAFPHMFDDHSSKFTIQSSLGTHVIMKLWPLMSEWILDNKKLDNKNLLEAETYIPAFKHLLDNCEGTNFNNESVTGEHYWLKGKEGYVGAYSSEGGKKILFDQLSQHFMDD